MSDDPVLSLHRRWDAELDRRGVTAIRAYLASDQVGASQNADVRLFVAGLEDPARHYVERWLVRKEADAALLAEARYHEMLKISRKSARWAFWAFVAGAGAAVIGIVFGLVSLVK